VFYIDFKPLWGENTWLKFYRPYIEHNLNSMDIVTNIKQKVKGRGLRVVLPEGEDERVLAAARKIVDEQIARPILLGNPDKIEAAAKKIGVSLEGIKVINFKDNDRLDAYAAEYMKGRDNLTPSLARRMVGKSLFFGAMMVKSGDADTMVGGVAHATATLIQAGTLTVGMMPGIKTVSSYFLMIIPNFQGRKDTPFIYADCAVNIDPTAEQLADIAIASAASARRILGEEPRVAMLSFSTEGSASSHSVDKVKKALQIVRSREPKLAIDGEFQADSAIVPRVAAKKVKKPSDVAGKANVLIFPDLNSGNIAYKLTQYMANAQAIGPFLQGFAKPLSDLSRGASSEDIVNTVTMTLAQLI
jgi:phosphate acetyltransferase